MAIREILTALEGKKSEEYKLNGNAKKGQHTALYSTKSKLRNEIYFNNLGVLVSSGKCVSAPNRIPYHV